MANLFEPGPPAVPDLARRTAVAELRALATRYQQLAADCSDLTSAVAPTWLKTARTRWSKALSSVLEKILAV